MTPLVIGIDPGTTQSAYVEFDGSYITGVATLPNPKVIHYLRSIDRRACVVIENVVSYGMPVGKETLETCVWIGRFYQVARDTIGPTQVSRLPRRAVKKYLGLKPNAGDKDVKAALMRRLERNPIEWNDLRSHQFAALALAITWWNTERERQPLKGQRRLAVAS